MSILIIGDSHLLNPDHLMTSLHGGLTQQGAVVHSIGVCGSTPADWIKATPGTCGGTERRGSAPAVFQATGVQTQPIKTLLSTEKPNLVVIVMGDTMAGYGKDFPKTWAWQSTTQLTKAISSTQTQCIWVGPPWGSEGGQYNKTYARVRQVSSFLSSNVAPCTYIDSLTFAKPGEWMAVDGPHLNTPSYQLWGKAITQAIQDTLQKDAANPQKPKKP